MKVLFDTNILIDYLQGHVEASMELEQSNNSQISIITKMEILIGTSVETQEIIREFLDNFTIIGLNEEIAEIAITIRKENKIKLPDAIIWATAKYGNCLLVTRNTKDFPSHAPDIRIPYNI